MTPPQAALLNELARTTVFVELIAEIVSKEVATATAALRNAARNGDAIHAASAEGYIAAWESLMPVIKREAEVYKSLAPSRES